MPPKKGASKTSTKAPNTSKSTTNRSTAKTAAPKATTKARSSKSNTASNKSAATAKHEATGSSKKSANSTSTATMKKRKAEDVDEEPAPEAKEAKKPRVTKPRVTKEKPKVVINHAPTTRLNVYVCGEGSSGELGLGPEKNAVDVKRPRLNPHLPADRVGVVQVAVGGMHCVALTYDNKILTWGVNDQGALGRDTAWEGGYKDIDDNKSDADSDSDDEPALNPHESTPTAIPSQAFPDGTVIVEVAAGDSSSFALTDDGQVYGWGTFRVRNPLVYSG